MITLTIYKNEKKRSIDEHKHRIGRSGKTPNPQKVELRAGFEKYDSGTSVILATFQHSTKLYISVSVAGVTGSNTV